MYVSQRLSHPPLSRETEELYKYKDHEASHIANAMPPSLPGSADAKNKFEDLSGVHSATFSNPYDALIEACHNDPVGTSPVSSISSAIFYSYHP